MMMRLTDPEDDAAFQRWLKGIDTCEHLTDEQIALALIENPILLCAAEHLSRLHGKPVARPDLDLRIQMSPRLHNVRRVAVFAHEQIAIATCQQSIAERGAHAERPTL